MGNMFWQRIGSFKTLKAKFTIMTDSNQVSFHMRFDVLFCLGNLSTLNTFPTIKCISYQFFQIHFLRSLSRHLFSFILLVSVELVGLWDVDREGVGGFIIFPAVFADVPDTQVSLGVIFDMLLGLGLFPALQAFPMIWGASYQGLKIIFQTFQK